MGFEPTLTQEFNTILLQNQGDFFTACPQVLAGQIRSMIQTDIWLQWLNRPSIKISSCRFAVFLRKSHFCTTFVPKIARLWLDGPKLQTLWRIFHFFYCQITISITEIWSEWLNFPLQTMKTNILGLGFSTYYNHCVMARLQYFKKSLK